MQTVVQYDRGEIFYGVKSGHTIDGYDVPGEYTPDRDPNYIPPTWAKNLVLWFCYSDEPLWIYGPTGCGKTAGIKFMASLLNYPVYEITGHSRLEFPEMVGHHTVQNGNMTFAYGPLALAMKHGGIFLLNEIDLLDPSTAAGLNSVLDGSPLSIPENGGELIKPHAMFKFVATANSNGASDDTGLYQGILRQNIAFMDRFVVVEASYPTVEVEKTVLKRAAPSLPGDLTDKMIRFANTVRKLFIGEVVEEAPDAQIELTISTRSLVRWAMYTEKFGGMRAKGVDVVAYAADWAFINRATPATRIALKKIMQSIM